MKIYPLAEIAQNYDALILDIWGVVYEGYEPYKHAVSFLNIMLNEGKKIVFLSNAPRPSSIARARFASWGLDMNNVDIYTSGDEVREQLLSWDDEIFRNLGKKIYHLGAERNHDLFADLNTELVSNIEQADMLIISAFANEAEGPDVHDAILKQAAQLRLPAICANPDISVYSNNQISYCAGSFAQKYQQLGGIVHYYGKPNARSFNIVLDRSLSDFPRNKIVMIGDTIETDILGASRVGIDSILVLSGNGQNNLKDCAITPTWLSYGLV